MLAIGREKVAAAGLARRVALELGDATDLAAYKNATFDKLTISFGIRNIPDVAGALAELRRVAKPGATLGVLEFAVPEAGPLAPLARAFVAGVVPALGALLSGAAWDEYAHLARSIAAFPPPAAFRELVASAGFETRAPARFACGAVVLYVGTAS